MSLNPVEDAAVKSGPVNPIAQLYEAERKGLFAAVRRLLNNHAAAEDVVQQAFTNLIAKSARTATTTPAYLKVTARHLALNYIRDARRRGETEVAGLDVNHIADLAPNPEAVTLLKSELRRVLAAIASLPPRRREAFVLNRIEELTYDEIALKMGISRNTVISTIVSAMADLDKRLA